MDLRKTVAFGEQIQDSTRVGHEAFVAERLCVRGYRMLVSENQHWQSLVILVERSDNRLARARKRQTMNIKPCGLRRVAGQQAFDRRAIRTDETLTGIFRIGETRFQQQ